MAVLTIIPSSTKLDDEAASDAVPTPVLTITGARACSTISRILIRF
jgi:hypothetical protein